ncbi:hypothetical protein [Aurantimonas sp. 22II-16-19i]|uniref:hypothetical protein n=1 Tax=Aurantimonas sp. 22II-16-19i TaxID=1317114 RepID=UPI001592BFE8|nr:hypothetical protein [Aurantimonas sp. 22II-16-19i]
MSADLPMGAMAGTSAARRGPHSGAPLRQQIDEHDVWPAVARGRTSFERIREIR